MARSDNNLKAVLQDTANAIRGKTGSSSVIIPRDFADTIGTISKVTYTPAESAETISKLYSGTLVNAAVPDDVTSLHPYLFYGMTSLQSVDFNNVGTIPADCCFGCSNLTTITFSTNTTRIEAAAFQNCSKLTDISIPHTITYIDNNAFYGVGSSYGQNTHTFEFVDNVGVETYIGNAAFQNSHLSNFNGVATYVGSYAFQSCSSLLTVNLKVDNGDIGSYGFQYCSNVETFTFDATSVVTSLGSGVFQSLATNKPNAVISPFDFRNSTFTSISSDVWSNCKFNGTVYFPATLSTISGNFLSSATGNWTLYFNSVPAVSSSSYLRSDTSTFTVKYCFEYSLLSQAAGATTWTSHTSQMVGYGDGFATGTTLPEYERSSGVAISWFSDSSLTTPVTTSAGATTVYYCTLGSTRVVWFVDAPTLVDGAVTISDGTNTYASGDAIPVNTSVTVTPSATDPNKNILYLLQVNGVDYTSAGSATVTMTQDLNVTAIYWDGVNQPINPVFSQNSPTLIATAIDNNTIPSTWNVEDYIDVTLTNNTIARVMIMHNTASTSNYKFNDDNTTCPLILGVSHMIPPTHQMNTSGTNAGGWNASAMRTYLNSSSFLDLFPTEWKNCFAMLKVKAMNGGSQGGTTLVESADKIFLFAEKEYYGGVQYSSSTEGDALNQLDLYRIHGVTTSNYSYLRKGTTPTGTDYAAYWERSTSASSTDSFCRVGSNGFPDYNGANFDGGVVVGFSLSLSHLS